MSRPGKKRRRSSVPAAVQRARENTAVQLAVLEGLGTLLFHLPATSELIEIRERNTEARATLTARLAVVERWGKL